VQQAQDAMRAAKLPSFHFVAGVWNGKDPSIAEAGKAGFGSISSYNYSKAPGDTREAHGFAERDTMYQRVWTGMANNVAGLPVILPLTAGWDKRAWGGSADALTDSSTPSDDQFRTHLSAARAFMRNSKVERAIVCCWNEYGEGSVIEPTRDGGDSRLKAMKEILP
jgi:hypothetical protein